MATALGAVGFASIIIQIQLLRELAVAFNGNELVYGLSLMIWLFSAGLGSYFAGKAALRTKEPLRHFIMIELALCLALPAELLFIRFSKIFFNIPSGVIPDLNSIIIISIVAIAPLSMMIGALFSLGSKALDNIGNMYIAESAGAVMGGIAFSFALIYFFSPFQVAGISGILLACSALYIYKHFVRTINSKRTRNLFIFAAVLAVNLVLIHPLGPRADLFSAKAEYKGLNLIRSSESIYGRISVVEDRGDFSYFENGNLAFSTASVAENEELANLSLLEANSPQDILLIGGGLGGVIDEIRKHKNIKRLDYIEFDPKLAELAGTGYPVIMTDGRHFIRASSQSYDLVMVNVGDPLNAAVNRFYTYEFMGYCKKRLNKGGVLMLRLSASESYMGKEQKQLNSSIFKTLALAFPYTEIIPGNTCNYYFATDKVGIITDDGPELVDRWGRSIVPTKYFNGPAISQILTPFRIKYMRDAIAYDRSTKVNSDLEPVSYRYGILMWLSYFPDIISIQLQKIMNVGLGSLASFILAAAFICLYALSRLQKLRRYAMPLALGLIGFCAMTLQLLAVYSFQALYGSIYSMIGMLFAVFMAGLYTGGYLTNVKFKGIRPKHLLISLLIVTAAFTLYLISASGLDHRVSGLLIPLFSFTSAILIGAFFPVAADHYKEGSLEERAGILYGADLFGGACSSFITTMLFIPAYGMIGTCLLSMTLNIVSLVISYYSS